MGEQIDLVEDELQYTTLLASEMRQTTVKIMSNVCENNLVFQQHLLLYTLLVLLYETSSSMKGDKTQ